MDGFQAVGVEGQQEVFAAGVWVFVGEEAVVQADFGAQAVCHGHPGDDAFDFDAGGAGGAAFGVGDDGGVDFGDVARIVFHKAGAFNDVAVFQADFVAGDHRAVCANLGREQSKEAFGRGFFKVGALYPDFFAEFEAAVAQVGVVGVDGGGAFADL